MAYLLADCVRGGAGSSCSLCNSCGTTTPTFNCCQTYTLTLGSVSGNIFIIQAGATLLGLEYKVCYGTDGFVAEGAANGPSYTGGIGYTHSGGDE